MFQILRLENLNNFRSNIWCWIKIFNNNCLTPSIIWNINFDNRLSTFTNNHNDFDSSSLPRISRWNGLKLHQTYRSEIPTNSLMGKNDTLVSVIRGIIYLKRRQCKIYNWSTFYIKGLLVQRLPERNYTISKIQQASFSHRHLLPPNGWINE